VRLLIVEDDERVAGFVAKGLRQEGYAVDHAVNGEDGLHLASTEPYDAAIVDIMLPKLDGIVLIERLRGQKITTPILILSARGSVDDRVKGLQAGGDDYLIKPFAFTELLARIQALIRRANAIVEPMQLKEGSLVMDLVRRKVTRQGVEIDLQAKEFALLEYLMRNAGRIVSKTMIMEHVWDYNFDPQTNVVEARVCRLRDKVDRPYDKKLIHTIRGAGYLLQEKE
jgi:two-component system OmpR family response regulator